LCAALYQQYTQYRLPSDIYDGSRPHLSVTTFFFRLNLSHFTAVDNSFVSQQFKSSPLLNVIKLVKTSITSSYISSGLFVDC